MGFRFPLLLSLLFAGVALSQSTVEKTSPVCAKPFLPGREHVDSWFRNIQEADPDQFRKFSVTPQRYYAVGEERLFNVLNLEDPSKVKFDQVTATLRATNKGVNIWVANTESENGHVTDQVIQSVLSGLTEHTPSASINPSQGIVEIEHAIFGMPPDIDGNGTIEFLLVDIQDGWDGEGGYVGGFFYERDQQTALPGSNKCDLMYIDTYPGIYRENSQNGSFVYDYALGTVAHEYQHLIHYRNDPEEEDFINEGLSEVASYFCGYGLRDPGHYLKNSDISLIEFEGNDFDLSLNHYAKVALWMFFLYEQFGLEFITMLSGEENTGVTGVNAAFTRMGISKNFNQIALDFFKTIVTNDPDVNPAYAFRHPGLRYLRARPLKRVTSFPASAALNVRKYALNAVEITNCDSLFIDQSGTYYGKLLSNQSGPAGFRYLDEIFLMPFSDSRFGQDYFNYSLLYMNDTNTNSSLILDINAAQRAYPFELYDGSGDPSFNIRSDGNTNAVRFEIPYDSTRLKGVEFYNGSSSGDIIVHIYEESIAGKSIPSSRKVLLKNALAGSWNYVDVEHLAVLRDADQVFEVGIEYGDKGVMGYENVTPVVGRSYLKPGSGIFQALSAYSLSDGSKLNGIWMIRIQTQVPLRYQPDRNGVSDLSWAGTGPNPFSPDGRNVLNIGYSYTGDQALVLDVFNVLGEKVYTHRDERLAGLIFWNGQNRQGTYVASGTYYLRLTSKRSSIARKLIVLRQ